MIVLLLAVAAHADDRTKGWLRADFGSDGLLFSGGPLVPMGPVASFAPAVRLAEDSAGIDLGVTLDAGSLSLYPAAIGRWSSATGSLGGGGGLELAWQAPPLPLLVEGRLRVLLAPSADGGEEPDAGTEQSWSALATVRGFAVGAGVEIATGRLGEAWTAPGAVLHLAPTPGLVVSGFAGADLIDAPRFFGRGSVSAAF